MMMAEEHWDEVDRYIESGKAPLTIVVSWEAFALMAESIDQRPQLVSHLHYRGHEIVAEGSAWARRANEG